MSVTRTPSLLWSTLRKKKRPLSTMASVRGAQSMADVSVASWQHFKPVESKPDSNPFQEDMSDGESGAQNHSQAEGLKPQEE